MKFGLMFHGRDAEYYACLSDDVLHAEVESIEKILSRAKETFAALERECGKGISEIRKALAHRRLLAMSFDDEPVTPKFREKLDVLIAERALKSERLAQIIRGASNGRVRSVSELTEFEAMVLWNALGGAS